MRTFCAALLLSVAGMGGSQQPAKTGMIVYYQKVPCSGGSDGHTNPPDCIPVSELVKQYPQPKPLKCGKWEHVEYRSCPASQRTLNMANGGWGCLVDEKPYCAPDMHSLTEKQYQALVDAIRLLTQLNDIHAARLKVLEEKTEFTDQLRLAQCPSKGWDAGKCLPFCDDITGTGSCVYRPKEAKGK